jgi:transcriptional regulator with XRE-family HTH domain
MKNVCKSLAFLRQRAGLSVKSVAKSIGRSSMAVINIESGKSLPSLPTVCKLADLYDVTIDVLRKDLAAIAEGAVEQAMSGR